MREVVQILVSWVVTTAASFAVVMWDERRLRGGDADRAWPAASRDSALVAFGALAVPVHFLRTRRGLLGKALGFVAGAVVAAASIAAEWVTSYLFDVLR